MLAAHLKVLLAGAPPETLRLVRAARERDVTILQEYLDAGVSRSPHTDAMYRMQTEIVQMCPVPTTILPDYGPVPVAVPTYERDPRGGWIKCLRCGFTSHHPKDVSEKYCGHCHQFHAL
jgi:hypothetical protein